ncbi:MAG: phosphotransferase family protein [Actinomycetes bacterium]
MTSTSVGAHPTAFNETGLPILRLALDVEVMGPVLEPLLDPLRVDGESPRLAYAKLMAYKKGNRGAIQYEVTVGGRSLTVLGKLYPQPTQMIRVDGILRGLWGGAFARSTDLGVPRPLGGVLDLSMLVYVPVQGTLLDEAIVDGSPTDAVELAAAWLARLHSARIDLDRRMQIGVEVTNLQAWAAMVAHAHPSHGPDATRLAADLATTVGIVQPAADAADTAIHKDFHYKHVLVGPGARVIDFDEVRFGDPMYDVGHFCAHLRLLACRHAAAADRIASAEERFLTTYAQRSGRRLGPRFEWYGAYTCAKIAKQLCSVRGVRPRPDSEDQPRQLSSILEQGMAFRDRIA